MGSPDSVVQHASILARLVVAGGLSFSSFRPGSAAGWTTWSASGQSERSRRADSGPPVTGHRAPDGENAPERAAPLRPKRGILATPDWTRRGRWRRSERARQSA